MKRTLLIAAAVLGTATAAMAQDVARPQGTKAAQQEAPPMRTRTQGQRLAAPSAPAPSAATSETAVTKPQPAAQPAAPVQATTNDAPPMRTRRTLSPAPAATGANR